MTKTLEEGVLEIIWQIVTHCYNQGLFPWQPRREQRRGLDAEREDRDDHGDGDLYYRLPLSIEETVRDHADHQPTARAQIPDHQHAEVGTERPHSQRVPPTLPFERPLFLRNHVGVRLANAPGVEGSRQQSPVIIDRENGQVLLSQRALWTLIDLVPWGNLPIGRASADTAEASPAVGENANNRRQNYQTERARVAGVPGTPSRSVAATPPAEAPEPHAVSTSLRVLSAKCLARMSRFHLLDTSGKNRHSGIGALYDELRRHDASADGGEAQGGGHAAHQSLIGNLLRLDRVSGGANRYRSDRVFPDMHTSDTIMSESREIQAT